jgi:peptidoglycan hydrolase-like protein with peptidoglycan-binding domain
VIDLAGLDPETSVKGAQQRLRHLGYYHRTPDGELDAATRRALEDFQRDHEIVISGELDDSTKAKLADSHGH